MLGSVLATSKRTQTIAARYDYDAWGNEINNTDTSDNPIGYTGHQDYPLHRSDLPE